MRICHSVSDPGGLINLHTSANSPGTPPGPYSGVEPSGTGKHVLAEASSIVPLGRCPLPDWRRHVAPCQPVLETLQYGL